MGQLGQLWATEGSQVSLCPGSGLILPLAIALHPFLSLSCLLLFPFMESDPLGQVEDGSTCWAPFFFLPNVCLPHPTPALTLLGSVQELD